MAKRTPITMFLAEDRTLTFEIKDRTETTCIDISGYALSLMIKRALDDADADALVTKTTGAAEITIAGTFHADPTTNTQLASVDLDSVDTRALAAGQTFYELKRTTSGSETVFAYGPLVLERGVHGT